MGRPMSLSGNDAGQSGWNNKDQQLPPADVTVWLGYNDDLLKQMKICSTNYIDFETELCALRKIRGDVFKKMQAGHKGFFQDCEVTKWSPEACSKVCATGEQKLIRSVLTHPGGENKKMQAGHK